MMKMRIRIFANLFYLSVTALLGFSQAAVGAAAASTSVYRIGYPVEVTIMGEELGEGVFAGNTRVVKHFGMGRLSWELAYVMPDRRTVYAGDDGSERGMFRFVADRADDLSAGRLFAAKLTALPDSDQVAGGRFAVQWIDLGHANNPTIDAFIAMGIGFADLFDLGLADGKRRCPNGFTPVQANGQAECLALKSSNRLGMSAAQIATAASRLETLRYAAYRGATTELRKFEGVTFSAKRNRLYIAISSITGSMSQGPSLRGIDDDIRLAANPCGAVYQLEIDQHFVATTMQALLLGQVKQYRGELAANRCDVDGIANPDNLTIGPGGDMLIIAEDTSAHQNDVIWAYDLASGKLSRLLTAPYGAETTSPWLYTEISDRFDYLVAVIQHPFADSDRDQAQSIDDFRAHVGVVKMPKTLAGDQVALADLALPLSRDDKRQIRLAPAMSVNGTRSPLAFTPLFRSGQRLGTTVWGQHINAAGQAMVNHALADLPGGISTSPDHTTLIKTADSLWTITQFEEPAAMMYLSKLAVAADGELTPVASKPVDLSAAYGGFVFCAGVPTPWGSHLGGEEYPVDAKTFALNGGKDPLFSAYLEYFAKQP